MAEILLEKRYGVMVPADEDSEEIIKELPNGKAMRCKFSLPRNIGNHRRFYAFLKIAFECQEFFDNIHHFRKWLIMKSGHYTTIVTPKGGTIFDADSIAFDKMDETTFRKVFNDCVQAFINTFGPKLPMNKLDEIIRF